MSTAITQIQNSNLPVSTKQSLIRRYYGNLQVFGRRARLSAHHGVNAVRQGGESLVVGAALGAAHAEFGLDVGGKLPADLALALLGLGFGVLYPTEASADDARNIGAAALAAFGFRQGYAYRAEKKLQSGGQPTAFRPITSQFHGDFFGSDYGAEDPIETLARKLP